MMKRKFFLLLAVASMTLSLAAQSAGPVKKYSVSTNSFWSNWFVQTNVTWNTFYVGGYDKTLSSPFREFPMGTKATDVGHRTALGFSLALGKWFTPGLGLRTKANGLWYGKAFDGESGKYMLLNEHMLFNLSNLFGGYNANRFWNLIPYIGGGVARHFDANRNSLVWSAGILNTFRVSKAVALNLELGYVSYGKDFWGTGVSNGLTAHQRDHQFMIEVGATFNIGKKGWSKTPDLEAINALAESEMDALNAQLADAQMENARLRKLLASQPKQEKVETKTVTVEKVVTAPVSVFFRIGQAKVASRKELQNVAELVKVAKDGQSAIVVTGYADSKTGNAKYNQQLSQRRAEAVAAELVKMGIGRERIQTVAAGGVDTLAPKDYNRRATVELK